jgi:hypothetical protein
VRNVEGQGQDVDQPLPLPAGVGDLAVGDEPELHWLALAALAALVGARLARTRTTRAAWR